MDYDLLIFNSINGLAGHSKILDGIGIFLGDWLPVLLLVFLFLLLFWPKKDIANPSIRLRAGRTMVFVAIAAGLAARFVVKSAILLFWLRPRPYVVLPGVHKLLFTIPWDAYQSFPSGHAIFFFALSAVIYKFNKKLGIFFFTASVFMGIARIYGGAHWPSDIAWGAALGTAVGFGVYFLYAKYFQKFDKVP